MSEHVVGRLPQPEPLEAKRTETGRELPSLLMLKSRLPQPLVVRRLPPAWQGWVETPRSSQAIGDCTNALLPVQGLHSLP